MGARRNRVTGKNWTMIYGPKNDGTYIIEYRVTEPNLPRPNRRCPRPGRA
jgi:hypothetical protein